jgi:hypothetical protein
MIKAQQSNMLRISPHADKWPPTALCKVAYVGVTHDVALVEVGWGSFADSGRRARAIDDTIGVLACPQTISC